MKEIVENIKVKGIFEINVYQHGKLIDHVEDKNHLVNGSQIQLAHLLGGDVGNRSITKIGFGTNGTEPVDSDTDLTGKFLKTISSVEYPELGQLKINWILDVNENNGMAILEFGLFTDDGTLITRKIRNNPLNKEPDISIEGTWIINFSKEN